MAVSSAEQEIFFQIVMEICFMQDVSFSVGNVEGAIHPILQIFQHIVDQRGIDLVFFVFRICNQAAERCPCFVDGNVDIAPKFSGFPEKCALIVLGFAALAQSGDGFFKIRESDVHTALRRVSGHGVGVYLMQLCSIFFRINPTDFKILDAFGDLISAV